MKLLAAALAVLFLLSWGIGAGSASWGDLLRLVSGGEVSDSARTILLELRLPRLLAAVLAGGMLGAAGCTTQNLFRNDLASPHVLGVVNTAALGAVIGLFLPGIGLTVPAMVFAALSLGILFLIGRRRSWDGATLILAGIAVNAFTSALTSGALYLADERLSALVFWLLGGFWRITWGDVILLAAVGLGACGILFRLAPELDMLLLGDRSAELAGVRMKRLKPLLMLTVAALSASVVSCCGVIGFVGLAVPHMVRMLCGGTFRKLLPGSILAGGFLLLLADLAARTVAAPQEIPVGILTSLAGGPFFFYLLLHRRANHD